MGGGHSELYYEYSEKLGCSAIYWYHAYPTGTATVRWAVLVLVLVTRILSGREGTASRYENEMLNSRNLYSIVSYDTGDSRAQHDGGGRRIAVSK